MEPESSLPYSQARATNNNNNSGGRIIHKEIQHSVRSTTLLSMRGN
jgi:hypothetical protein